MGSTAREAASLPGWAVAGIRRAALRSCLGWVLPMGAAMALLTGIGALLWLGEAESPWIPVFWLTLYGGVLLVFGWEFFLCFRVLIFPRHSPEVRYLEAFGDPAEILREIGAELESPDVLRLGRELHLTAGWLVISGGERFSVRRLDDLVWVYPKVEKVRLPQNAGIIIRRIPYAEFRCALGGDCRARALETETAALMEVLADRKPGLLRGASEELEAAWARDKTAFVTAVQNRAGEGQNQFGRAQR